MDKWCAGDLVVLRDYAKKHHPKYANKIFIVYTTGDGYYYIKGYIGSKFLLAMSPKYSDFIKLTDEYFYE